jgi:tRNA threonylcarbamoyladenosine biosynthesis protein TsaE
VNTANRAVYHTQGVAKTRALARRVARLLRPGDVVFLQGPLGAGKTAFAQGVGQALKVETTVNSPTFVLMTRHDGPTTLYHADLYRLTEPAEVAELALDEQAADGVLLIEWPERGLEVLPQEHLLVVLEPVEGAEKERRISIVANGERYRRVLDGLGARG